MQSTSSNQHYESRCRIVEQQQSNGNIMYPQHFNITLSIPQYIERYNHIEPSESLPDQIQSIAGRVMAVRKVSAKAIFYDIHANGNKMQTLARLNDFHLGRTQKDQFIQQHANIRRGDIIGIIGYPAKTRSGELSIFATNTILLAPCLRMIPKTLCNTETRYRQRYLDLILNGQTTDIFCTRAKIISYIRRFLDSRGFLEVETPILNQIAGGGNAKKFETTHNSLHLPMYLRIAPELYLKQLVIGGMDRVYEIGRQFRNETADATHNPEFTSCEFYCAYWEYNNLMNITEEMVSGLVKEITGGYKIQYQGEEIDFTAPWPRYNMIEEIETNGGFEIPRPFSSNECNLFLKERCKELFPDHSHNEIEYSTTAKLLDRLCGYFIENKIRNPAFITCHPAIMSPLAKNHRNDEELTERFECFVMGNELCNAYTELNDPKIQRERFIAQSMDRELDDEAMDYDENYCKALEYGLPPTGGWGLGIDRLTMWLTDSNTIKEVLLFPQMKPIVNNNNNSEENSEENDGQIANRIIGYMLMVMVAGIIIIIYEHEINGFLAEFYGVMQQNPICGTAVNLFAVFLCIGLLRR